MLKCNSCAHLKWSNNIKAMVYFLFLQEQPAQANFANICTGLEVLSFLLTVLQNPAILSSFKPLQRGISACMTCANTKVLRAVHTLLSRLMSIFPTEPSMWNFTVVYSVSLFLHLGGFECHNVAPLCLGMSTTLIFNRSTKYRRLSSRTHPQLSRSTGRQTSGLQVQKSWESAIDSSNAVYQKEGEQIPISPKEIFIGCKINAGVTK